MIMSGLNLNRINSKIKLGLLVGILSVSINTLYSQEILVESRLKRDSIVIGEQTELLINVTTPKNSAVIFPEFTNSLGKGIEIILSSDVQKKQSENSDNYEKKILLTSFNTGKVTVPSIEIKVTNGKDTVIYNTDELEVFVEPYILFDSIPVDTIYSKTLGFIVLGHNNFEREIEQLIPDSIKKNISADSLMVVKQMFKQQLIPFVSSHITQKTSLGNKDEILKIIESPVNSFFIVDKGGILEEFIIPGSVDTIFVKEFDEVFEGQPLFTLNIIKDINDDLYKTSYNLTEFWHDLKNFMSKYWWIFIIIIIVVAGVLYYLLYLKNNKKPVIFKVKAKEPAHVIALTRLAKIKDEKIWDRGELKEYYVQLTDVLREYIENRFGIYAREMVTSEILNNFLGNEYLSADDYKKIEQILDISDSVKFAKYEPIHNENMLSLNNAFEFVEDTKEVIEDNLKLKQLDAEIEFYEKINQDTDKNSGDAK